MNRKLIKEEAKNVIRKIWIYVFLAILVVGLASATSVMLIGLIAIPLEAGLFIFLRRALAKGEYNFEDLIKPYKNINHSINILGAKLLVSIIFFVGMILFIVPGIIWFLTYSQTIRIMSEDENIGIMDALKKSKQMMYGHKWELFVLYLSFIGHYLLAIITFGLWLLYLVPYLELSTANYYIHLQRIYQQNDQSFNNPDNNYQSNANEYNAEIYKQD